MSVVNSQESMELDKFLNLMATVFGALGAVYVMLGILAMSPELMERQTHSYLDFSIPQIEALANQKAENVAGFVFVVVAFVLAATTLAFVPDGVRAFESKTVALGLAAVLAGGLYVTLHFVSQGIYRYQKLAMGEIITSRYLDQIAQRGRLEQSDSTNLPIYARALLDLEVPTGESVRSLLERVAAKIGKTAPPELDYSAVEPQK